MPETPTILTWTFASERKDALDISECLVQGEEVIAAYDTIRGVAVFTNKRLIVRDTQGIRSEKIQRYSLPYSCILMWCTKNPETADFSKEIELWIKTGHIKVNLKNGIDAVKFEKTFTGLVLSNR